MKATKTDKKQKNPLKAVKRASVLEALETMLEERKTDIINGKRQTPNRGKFDVKYAKERFPLQAVMALAWTYARGNENQRFSPDKLKKRAKKLGFKVKKSAAYKRKLARADTEDVKISSTMTVKVPPRHAAH
jgi:hypothetical protein